GRLLLGDVPTNRLLAFDGTLGNGKDDRGFSSGDGKAARYWVAGFRSPQHTITWKYRLNEPASFDVTLTYNTARSEAGGAYAVRVGDQVLEGVAEPSTAMKTVKLGTVKLQPGEGAVTFAPTKAAGGGGADLLQLFEINLVPA